MRNIGRSALVLALAFSASFYRPNRVHMSPLVGRTKIRYLVIARDGSGSQRSLEPHLQLCGGNWHLTLDIVIDLTHYPSITIHCR